MIEALVLMLIGSALARTVLWPLQIREQEARARRDEEQAEEIVADIKRRVPPVPEPRV